MRFRPTTSGSEPVWTGSPFMVSGGSGARAVSADLTPVWPQGCTGKEQSLHCAAPGLAGTLAVKGVGRAYSAAMGAWLASAGHCANLMNAEYTEMAVAMASNRRGPMGTYWTMVFGTPMRPARRGAGK